FADRGHQAVARVIRPQPYALALPRPWVRVRRNASGSVTSRRPSKVTVTRVTGLLEPRFLKASWRRLWTTSSYWLSSSWWPGPGGLRTILNPAASWRCRSQRIWWRGPMWAVVLVGTPSRLRTEWTGFAVRRNAQRSPALRRSRKGP